MKVSFRAFSASVCLHSVGVATARLADCLYLCPSLCVCLPSSASIDVKIDNDYDGSKRVVLESLEEEEEDVARAVVCDAAAVVVVDAGGAPRPKKKSTK